MRYGNKVALAAILLLSLASCAGRDSNMGAVQAAERVQPPAVSDVPVKLGAAYKVGAITYTPEDVATYDDVGYASWYGPEMEGRATANGEIYQADRISGAHKTLPLPSYVEVTALDSGRTILVRINDRGPFANDRLIDLSESAARQLGLTAHGVAGVRVRRVNPPEQERSALRSGQSAALRMDTPESLLKILRERLAKLPRPAAAVAATPSAAIKPAPKATAGVTGSQTGNDRFVREGASPAQKSMPSAPIANESGYVVQIAAFSSRAAADRMAGKAGANVKASGDGRLFRVRYGPYATLAEADAALADARKRGYPQARLLRE